MAFSGWGRGRWARVPAGLSADGGLDPGHLEAGTTPGAPLPGGQPGRKVRGIETAALEHLEHFARTRRGVEAYVEPATTMTEMTVVLVALDGEWTRRRIASGRAAADLGKRLGVPVYAVQATGYPPRMREWSARQK